MTYLMLVVGLVGLFLGGELLVRGAVGLARRFGLSPVVIGLTVVGFGTSTPELLVSVQAALDGAPAIALGNVVGSNTANILLILGFAAVICPVLMRFTEIRRDLGVMLGATALLWLMLLDGGLGRVEGLVLVAALVAYLWVTLRSEAGKSPELDPATLTDDIPPALGRSIAITLAGLVALILAARALIWSATIIARDFGLSEAVIGLTVVAVGTSLPELATSVVAAYRRQSALVVGNVIGSNIFNILSILGLTALIAPMEAEARFARLDLPVAFAVAALVALLARWPGRVGRLPGLALLAGYAGYIGATATV